MLNRGGVKKLVRNAESACVCSFARYSFAIILEEAVMAVTAPNYVLEESLSSQHLWKETAGARPPQPLEERAFYEKMWAQNFARSQVHYQLPVEVLTLGSGEESAAGAAHDYYNYYPDTAAATATATPNHAAAAAAEIVDGGAMETNFHDGGGMMGRGGGGGDQEAQADYLTRRLQDQQRHLIPHSIQVGPGSVMSSHSQPPPAPPLGAAHWESSGKKVQGDLTVLVRGDNVFGTTVSKSFARSTSANGLPVSVDTVNISIASYRVVEKRGQGKFAQYLVIYREGSVRDTVGVWKRYRDFEELAAKVNNSSRKEGCTAVMANISPLHVTEENEEDLPNAKTSWRLLKKRQRWCRCLDAGYLSLKVFLLERFLHDILFESSTPKLLRDFVGADPTFRNYGTYQTGTAYYNNNQAATTGSAGALSHASSYGLYSTPEF
jgi:hypothetical protein